ncbi:tyrosine-type recombinase/integrase [Phycisphaerales bacterium AB-hyl4]|uniref:Tyrosine-type recombinase/integrase n=1 Tax=Natronomicrosphaera hydrolytica TaxID=3242702 RepID=A0ABV4U8B1_9BACT
MARNNERGLELTFHKPSKRWRKRIGGKDHWFGFGKGVSDRKSYKAALERYRAFQEEQAQRRASLTLDLDELIDREDGPWNERAVQAIDAVQGDPDAAAKLAAFFQRGVTPAPSRNSSRNSLAAIETLVTDFLAVQKQRRDTTERHPERLGKKQRLSPKAHRFIKDTMTQFKDWCIDTARVKTLDDPQRTERLVLHYREHLTKLLADEDIAPSTLNNRLKYLPAFFRWAWENRRIVEQPRTLRQACQKLTVAPSAKPLTVRQVRRIWEAADGRLRAHISLALNAGLYDLELSDICGKHLSKRDGASYLAKHRRKTGVPYKIKLWPLTVELIAKHRDSRGADELLFRTKKGHPLAHFVGDNKSSSLAQAFKKAAVAAAVDHASWSMLRDTVATDIEKIARRIGDRGITSQLLAHADDRTARFYVDQSPIELETSKLDAALDELAEHYDLDGRHRAEQRKKKAAKYGLDKEPVKKQRKKR